MRGMSLIRAGLVIRALRRAQGMRQIDLARKAHVCQQTISNIERGRFGSLSIDTFVAVARELGAEVPLVPHWRGAAGLRLLDRAHARIQQSVAETLTEAGWSVRAEVTFNVFGERGSVDVAGVHAAARAVLIVEVKSELVSVEETLRSLDVKRRVFPGVIAREAGWKPIAIGVVLVLPDGSTHREAVARHGTSLGRTLPERTVAIRKWVQDPSGSLAGIWFLRDTTSKRGTREPVAPHRVRAAVGQVRTTRDHPD